MLEINPVLAGKFDNPPYAQIAAGANDAGNSAGQGAGAGSAIDPRRYTQYDRTSLEVHTDNNMSFGDFLDMVNPLQHIPIVSSVYRAISGDTINPISRVAGDIMYGGAMGIASAITAGIGAIGNSMLESTTGKDTAGTMVAALLGTDGDKIAPAATGSADGKNQILLAQQTPSSGPAAPNNLAANQAFQTAATDNAAPAAAGSSANPSPTAAAPKPGGSSPFLAAKAFPLNRNQMANSGVVPVSPSDPGMAIALNEGSHGVRIGQTIYTNRFLNGTRQGPASAATATTASAAGTSGNSSAVSAAGADTQNADPSVSSGQSAPLAAQQNAAPTGAVADASAMPTVMRKNPLPQSLIDDMTMFKSLNQYNSTAAGNAGPGANLNIIN